MESTTQFKANFMRDSCTKWNLAEDVELLKHLEKFSQSILRNAAIAGKCMDALEENLNLTYLKVRSVSNEFNSVGDTQFVENRAHDEDETIHDAPEKMDVLDFSEDPPINSKLEESLSTCIRLLEDKFETIQLSESDSDDEGFEHSQVVLKPRKCYVERPLPHLIGSYKFLNDSTLGLSLILQEQEDILEAEDDGGTLFTRNVLQDLDTLPQTEHRSRSNSISRKSQTNSIYSYDIITGNEFFQRDHQNLSITFHPKVADDNDDNDFETSGNASTNVQSKEEITTAEILVSKQNKEDNQNVEQIGSPSADKKPYSKERMKSVLEQLYSNPFQDNIFAKKISKTNVEIEPANTESIDKSDKITKAITSNQVFPTAMVPFKKDFDNNFPQLNGNSSNTRNDDHSSRSIFHNTQFKEISSTKVNVENSNLNFSGGSKSNASPDSFLDDLLQSTEVLHSVTKNRVKNHNNRRPPSRKLHVEKTLPESNVKSITKSTPTNLPIPSISKSKENTISNKEKSPINQPSNANLLSPSTDEEDLFTVGNSVTPSDLSSDRLFQPLPSRNVSSNIHSSSSSELSKPPTQWDPFSEDDASLFNTTSSWTKTKFAKRSDNLLSDLVSSPSDENLFTQTKENTKPSFFDYKPSAKLKKHDSLFDDDDDDEGDDDMLFSSTFDKPSLSVFLQEKTKEISKGETSSSTSVFKSKNDFLNDPLGFSQDCESDQ